MSGLVLEGKGEVAFVDAFQKFGAADAKYAAGFLGSYEFGIPIDDKLADQLGQFINLLLQTL